MVNRAYLFLSVLALALWFVAYSHMPGLVAGLALAGIVGFTLWCEYSRVTTLARIGQSRRRPVSRSSNRPATGRGSGRRELK
ncbi:hypothetical protein DUY81_02065 [Acidipropionibacterium acidipropionici]|jgi:Flp pilus assembly protein TadB|uniref:Uncharacterized protein n=2 Tax=Acidipropionibacterium acidipropionici TaxID=1748 RepID=A0A142KHU3_9ACTN|nr:hypothetical protein [Acidipropionibacterium acidipropionici]AFV91118.1 hypothetical protein PACID_33610 [Acidipropionibacterium acidipropionici ATCC 4875]ALN14810.1 hypothetical protein ASQ49_05415 [Acidipropionibacterium acidipropionici]AMS05681.1 hypothetical protein AXH35_09680 [Acidipropionibacterium acidipropionici]AOZ47148.1 hypothetical protein A8L58_11120 [Acidipropionibacterium acidipropionici]APZ09437.1 hypothetical protein BWX38_09505 [Acidipropionibacterium acidipropionici]